MVRTRTRIRSSTITALVVLSALGAGLLVGGTVLAQTGQLTFDDQALGEDETVTVENVTTSGNATVIVTYANDTVADVANGNVTDGNATEEVVAGLAEADDLTDENVTVTIEDTGGFPGEHTAWVFDDEDLPEDLEVGDDATPVADAALDSESAEVFEGNSLNFSEQEIGANNTVAVTNVFSDQDSTVLVTYTNVTQTNVTEQDGIQQNETREVVAGLADADTLEGENVTVTIEDTGGFPGEHTAWLFDDEDLPDDLDVGDDATPVADAALDSESADVVEKDYLDFFDQELSQNGTVALSNVNGPEDSTAVVTYTNGSDVVVAGFESADGLDEEPLTVEIEDTGGFPGEHAAWLFNDEDLPADLEIGDNISALTSQALYAESGNVSAPPEGNLTFEDQALADDGSVTVGNVTSPENATLVLTYTNDTEEVIAGAAAANDLEGEDVTVGVRDTGGFPGEHTAWLFQNEDLPEGLAIGDDATPVADAALASDTATVSEATEDEDEDEDVDEDEDEE